MEVAEIGTGICCTCHDERNSGIMAEAEADSALQCSAVQCSAVQCSAVQCSEIGTGICCTCHDERNSGRGRGRQCSAVQCSAVQCSAVQCSECSASALLCSQRDELHVRTHRQTDKAEGGWDQLQVWADMGSNPHRQEDNKTGTWAETGAGAWQQSKHTTAQSAVTVL